MATGGTLVEYPFVAGIDEGTRDELVEPGQGWLVLENGRQQKRGAYGTRYGFTALTSTLFDATSPTTGYRLFADKDTIVRVADSTAQVYDGVLSRWRPLTGAPPSCTARIVDIPTAGDIQGASVTVEDIAYCGGYMAIAYLDSASTTVWASVINATTGALVTVPVTAATAAASSYGLLATYSTYFLLFVANGTGTSITLLYLNTASASTIEAGWVSVGDVGSDMTAGAVFAVTSLTAGAALAYVNDSGGTSQVTVKLITIAGATATATINTSSATPTRIDVAGSTANTLWVAWNETTACKMKGFSPTSLTTVTATTATIITVASSCGGLWIAESSVAGKGMLFAQATRNLQAGKFQISAGVAATDGTGTTIYNVINVGKPIQYASRYFTQVYYGDSGSANTQYTILLVEAESTLSNVLRPIANPAPSLSTASTYRKGKITAGGTSTKLYYPMCVRTSSAASSSALIELDFASDQRCQAVSLGKSVFLSGGVLAVTDGSKVTEAGFVTSPTKPVPAQGAATGITAVTGWRYVAVWEDVDSDGNWVLSGISEPSASTGAITDHLVTIDVSPLNITYRVKGAVATYGYGSARCALYRTLDGGEAPYYRVGVIVNDPASATGLLTYTDAISDATLAANAVLYRQYGVQGTAQDRRAPPGLGIITEYNGMLVGATGSDVWYSGQFVSGEATWFNPIFQMPIPSVVTGLASQDGVLYIFTRRAIYAVSGEPPSDNGASGGLGTPQKLAADVGCIDSRSVVVTSQGVFFQSERGIEVLTRARSVEWVGESIVDTLAAYPVVTAATLDSGQSLVYIELAAAESSGVVSGSGRTLVYDLALKIWTSVDRRKNSSGTADSPAQSAAMVYTGSAYRYAWMGANGTVYTENQASYLDADSTFVAKRAISGNVKAGGVQGSQAVNKWMLLAKQHTAHDLNVDFAYDYSSTYKTVRLYTNANLNTITAAIPNMQLEHALHDDAGRCEAIRVRLQDVTPSTGSLGTGQGGTWIAMAFEVVPQTGGYKLPDESR